MTATNVLIFCGVFMIVLGLIIRANYVAHKHDYIEGVDNNDEYEGL